MSFMSVCSIQLFKSAVFRLVLCLDDLSGVESELLKFSTVVLVSVSPFISTNTCLKYLNCPMLATYINILALGELQIGELTNTLY